MLPDKPLLIGQKLIENAKIEKFRCDILGDFQTLCSSLCLTCTYREGKNVKYGEHCKKRNILEMQFQVKKWILRFPSLAPLLPTQQQKKTKISKKKKKKLGKVRETNSGQILHFVSRMFIL